MKKLELLSPAGSFEALVAAINNGANAVYLGSKLFNARRLANNFNDEELKKAVQYAHLNNARICLTLNTLVKNHEIPALLKQIKRAYAIGVDALIMQDLTFAPLIKKHYPQIEIHASTQATLMNTQSVKFWQDHVSVFVLARELTKSQVSAIYKNTNAHLEFFVHGHLCISYSGQCLISSLIGKRSGNRGMCASSCRKPYNGNSYLLSAKDLCMINSIKDMVDAGVKTVKIEGRMKSPEYVATTTRSYRKQIDDYYKKKLKNASKQTIDSLKIAFNREFTKGYFNDEKSIVDPTYSAKRGIFLGEIKHGLLRLKEELQVHDGVGIIHNGKRTGDYVKKILVNDESVESAKKGQSIRLQLPGFRNGGKVYLMNRSRGHDPLGKQKTIPFDLSITIAQEKPVSITVAIKNQKVTYPIDFLPTKPRKPLTKEKLNEEFLKYTSPIFKINNLSIKTDQSFIPISKITQFRNEIDQILLDTLVPIREHVSPLPIPKFTSQKAKTKQLHVRVYTVDGVRQALDAGADTIYYNAFAPDVKQAKEIADQQKKRFYLHTPMVMHDDHLEQLKKIVAQIKPDGVEANNLGVLNLKLPCDIVLGYQMNIFNDNQLAFYNKPAVASIELNLKELDAFANKKDLLYYAHGYPVVMTFKEGFNQAQLTDQKGYTFKLRKNATGATEMLYSRSIAIMQRTKEVLASGITQLYLDLEEDVFDITALYKDILDGKYVSIKQFKQTATIGNLEKGVM